MTSIAISSGHGKYVRGAVGYIDEVNEARRVVEEVAKRLSSAGVTVAKFHDDVSHSQSENLKRICNWHNAQKRTLDVSVHFNAYETTTKPMGTECLYYSQSALAGAVASAVASAGKLINRGAKKRTDLAFLNNTDEPAILIEVCFVDSKADVDLYHSHFDDICEAIAVEIGELQTPTDEHQPQDLEWREDVTATVFAGGDDPQDSAYGTGKIDGNKPGVSLPFKWRDKPAPALIIEGPKGTASLVPMVDVGPWNIDDPDYVLYGERPLVETQFDEETEAQNGMVPTNDAAIDLTPATAKIVGIDGKGKVRWRFA